MKSIIRNDPAAVVVNRSIQFNAHPEYNPIREHFVRFPNIWVVAAKELATTVSIATSSIIFNVAIAVSRKRIF